MMTISIQNSLCTGLEQTVSYIAFIKHEEHLPSIEMHSTGVLSYVDSNVKLHMGNC